MPTPTRLLATALVAGAALAGAACSSTSSTTSTNSVPADAMVARGHQVYAERCAACHGSSAQGGTGPRLIGVSGRFPNIEGQIAVIRNGVKGSAMPPWQSILSADDIRAVAEYTRSLR
jgi:mono/diheme cytochrome c family protein